jgi:hypothetical protein
MGYRVAKIQHFRKIAHWQGNTKNLPYGSTNRKGANLFPEQHLSGKVLCKKLFALIGKAQGHFANLVWDG